MVHLNSNDWNWITVVELNIKKYPAMVDKSDPDKTPNFTPSTY